MKNEISVRLNIQAVDQLRCNFNLFRLTMIPVILTERKGSVIIEELPKKEEKHRLYLHHHQHH